LILATVLLAGSLAAGAWLNVLSFGVLAFYVLLQVLYNVSLKKQPVADVFTIATGFVLRAALGAAAISVPISGWLLYCTGTLALTLGFAKRRNEFLTQGEERNGSRESLAHYNKATLDAFVAIFSIAAAVFYAIYALQSKTAATYPFLPATVPFVWYGITRYVLVSLAQDEGAEPAELILRDPHLIFSILGFLATAFLAMSGLQLPIVER
jgi:4-hydroxybenzoate polyprenyltransferase